MKTCYSHFIPFPLEQSIICIRTHHPSKQTQSFWQSREMLPLSLLKGTAGSPLMVELKNGETFNGHLEACDNWMNLQLREVICTSRDGDRFWRMPQVYIRGNTIKACSLYNSFLYPHSCQFPSLLVWRITTARFRSNREVRLRGSFIVAALLVVQVVSAIVEGL